MISEVALAVVEGAQAQVLGDREAAEEPPALGHQRDAAGNTGQIPRRARLVASSSQSDAASPP